MVGRVTKAHARGALVCVSTYGSETLTAVEIKTGTEGRGTLVKLGGATRSGAGISKAALLRNGFIGEGTKISLGRSTH